MSRLAILIASSLAVGAGSGSFLATYYAKGQLPPATATGQLAGLGPDRHEGALAAWLELSPERAELVRKADPGFHAEAPALQKELGSRREVLAGLLQSPDSPDEQILAQVEQVIEAHNQLERRVARHVLAIRPQLTPGQQKRLMGLCANGVRRCQRHRYGATQGAGACSGGHSQCGGVQCCGGQCGGGQCCGGQSGGGQRGGGNGEGRGLGPMGQGRGQGPMGRGGQGAP